jgi:hypothetical protein
MKKLHESGKIHNIQRQQNGLKGKKGIKQASKD